MLREDANGDYIGSFAFEGRRCEYRVRGYGKPLLITAGISPIYGSYAWRYLFECLAGTSFVYSLDIESMMKSDETRDHAYHSKLIEYFLREVIGIRTAILAGDQEYAAVTAAAIEARALVDKVIFLCPDRAGRFRLRIAIVAGKGTEKGVAPLLDRLHRISAGTAVCTRSRARRGVTSGSKSPARICEDIMRLLR
ncbi:hypothetical protein [Methanocella arvoryzae]|uniref:Uncharacterized protein n=1 Tax=Methanocella arvoryzae (strain DSM 22066 / NBRC 105507 / MRE50) TaxID=351160 RepID=Q0W311_METAR|nr:hypothetical protein [Methanocella arvoryzae]CAJ37232.1 hypothetical protein RCIX2095 [Methanocella arvoryzae MRE50]